MSRIRIEDVIARWEARPIELVDTKADVDALIAAWRELCADRDSWREQAEYWEKIANVAVDQAKR